MSGGKGRKIQSVQSSLEIITVIQQLEGASVSELADEVGLTPGTVHTHLMTLVDHGFVVKESNTYELGTQFVVLGEYVRNHSELYQAGKDEVDRLAEETGECVHLIVEQQGWEVSLYEQFGAKAAGTELYIKKREDRRRTLHSTASGKAILAYMSDDQVSEIVDEHGLPEATPNTITDKEELFEELKHVRDRGFALNDEEEVLGTRAVAGPIRDSDRIVRGAVSLSAPSSRLTDDLFRTKIPKLITEAANIIELNLQATSLSNR
jgi:IclR family transcriptional regulator, arginine deiminase pathway regulator